MIRYRVYRSALVALKRLTESDPAPDTPEGRLLEALAIACAEYERFIFPTAHQEHDEEKRDDQ